MKFIKIVYENHTYLINATNITGCNLYEVEINGKEHETRLEIYINGTFPLKLKGEFAIETFNTLCELIEVVK